MRMHTQDRENGISFATLMDFWSGAKGLNELFSLVKSLVEEVSFFPTPPPPPSPSFQPSFLTSTRSFAYALHPHQSHVTSNATSLQLTTPLFPSQ